MENRHGQLLTPVAVYPASIPGCGFSLFDEQAGLQRKHSQSVYYGDCC